MTALFFANGFGFGTWVAHLPLFKSRLGLSDGLLGSALLCASLATLVSMPIVGSIIARFGSRAAATVTAIGASVALILPFLATTPLAFVGAAVVLAGFYSAMDVSMNVQAVVVEGRGVRPIMSSFHALFSTGGLAGSLVSALLVARGFTLEADGAFVATACCALVVVAVPALVGEAAAANGRIAGGRTGWTGFRPVALFGVLALLGLIGEGAMADWSGIYLRSSLGLTAAASAAGFGAFSVAMALGRASGDVFVARAGATRTLVAGAAVAAVALAIGLGLHTVWSAYLSFALVGLGLANVVPIVFSAAGRVRSLAPGVGIASVSTIGYAGFLIGPPTIGFASDAFSLRVALGFVVACLVALALLGPKALRSSGET